MNIVFKNVYQKCITEITHASQKFKSYSTLNIKQILKTITENVWVTETHRVSASIYVEDQIPNHFVNWELCNLVRSDHYIWSKWSQSCGMLTRLWTLRRMTDVADLGFEKHNNLAVSIARHPWRTHSSLSLPCCLFLRWTYLQKFYRKCRRVNLGVGNMTVVVENNHRWSQMSSCCLALMTDSMGKFLVFQHSFYCW